MLPSSLCRLWQPDRAANAAQDNRSYTTAWGTIHPSYRAWLASAYDLKGQTDRAAAELAEARRLSSGDRFSSIARAKAWYSGTPTFDALLETTFLVGLRKAGM